MLEFEHLIQINDPEAPHIPFMSRKQLWEGLVFRARHPGHFTPTLECSVTELTEDGFIRVLGFGEHSLRDRVVLVNEREIRTRPAEEEPVLFAESITRIEEPAPGHLFVRFLYRRDSGNEPGGMNVDEYLKQAYVENDRTAIRLLRKFAEEGLPGESSWLQ
ncbi:MAG: DUF1857 family protein [Pseudomonadales bacterium]|nr:DUF1857 family protein [Pseudomonadales bacterium]